MIKLNLNTRIYGGIGLILIAAFVVISGGCLSSPIINDPAPVPFSVTQEPAVTITPVVTELVRIVTPENNIKLKIKIMSIDVQQATLVQIPIMLKIKNVGDVPAPDVYTGVVGISTICVYNNYPGTEFLIRQGVTNLIVNGSPRLDTGIRFENSDSDIRCMHNATVESELLAKDYIGEILPGEIKTGQVTIPTKNPYSVLVKIAWVDGTDIIDIY